MPRDLFSSRYGIIPACDLDNIRDLDSLIDSTCDLEFIQGYKVGMSLVVPYGILKVTETIRKHTELPIIYDHQKFGTDIPDICGGKILNTLKKSGISGLIVFPHSGIETLKAVVNSCKEYGLVPIVGGAMTHKGYLAAEGGYIYDSAPERIYRDAAKLNVHHFVVPGNRLESMKTYRSELEKIVSDPKFLFPGVGKGQGGDIIAAFDAVKPYDSYAVVGRGIYAEKNIRESARNLWENVRSRLTLTP